MHFAKKSKENLSVISGVSSYECNTQDVIESFKWKQGS